MNAYDKKIGLVILGTLCTSFFFACGGAKVGSRQDCSQQYPEGDCPTGEVCLMGNCIAQVLLCSTSNPVGLCPPNGEGQAQICDAGMCTALDDGETCMCSAQCPQGLCQPNSDGLEQVCNQGVCELRDCECSQVCPQGTCADDAADNPRECISGICITDQCQCSSTCKSGSCPEGEVCVEGVCQLTQCTCDVNCPLGICPQGKICIAGECVTSCECAIDCKGGYCENILYECVDGVCAEQCSEPYHRCGNDLACCRPDQLCEDGQCVSIDACINHDECNEDSYCQCIGGEDAPCNTATKGQCISYDANSDHPGFNEQCSGQIIKGIFSPVTQCKWDGPTDNVQHCSDDDQCQGNVTCIDGLLYEDRYTLDIPISNPNAFKAIDGICAGCLDDSDCNTEYQICDEGVCRRACFSGQNDCLQHEVCVEEAADGRGACYECQDEEMDTDCYGGLTCAVGYCIDPNPSAIRVMSSPVVIDFDFDNDPKTIEPSIAFVATDYWQGGYCNNRGVIRVIDGKTCKTQFVVNRQRDDKYADSYGSFWEEFQDAKPCTELAVADLDGPIGNHPEIIAAAAIDSTNSRRGGLITFEYDQTARSGRGAFRYRWHTRKDPDNDRQTTSDWYWDHSCNYQIGGWWWPGPAVYDLEGDGYPEVFLASYTYDNEGFFLDRADLLCDSIFYSHHFMRGYYPVVSDLDGDGIVSWIDGAHVYDWNANDKTWSDENKQSLNTKREAPYFRSDVPYGDYSAYGHIAVGDFGTYTADSNQDDRGIKDGIAEVAKVRGHCLLDDEYNKYYKNGSLAIQTSDGRNITMPNGEAFEVNLMLNGEGVGGPPTIADFDGDCRVEVAIATKDSFGVFDPDCDRSGTIPQIVTCNGKQVSVCATYDQDYEPGILWRHESQDESSGLTGSSVFDFDGDGTAEAVYSDECFTRVYDGRNGNILYSQNASSLTWHEYPIIADVDGDHNAELVIPGNKYPDKVTCTPPLSQSTEDSGDGIRFVDKQFPGLQCTSDNDCLGGVNSCACKYGKDSNGECNYDSQNEINLGLCTCNNDSDCGDSESSFICSARIDDDQYDYLDGLPKSKVCRSQFVDQWNGIRVYADSLDRWVDTRRVWNQHPYFVTNIEDDGKIGDAREGNWTNSKLNSFRQNQLYTVEATDSPDITVGHARYQCITNSSSAQLTAQVCNRGVADIGQVDVGFYYSDVYDNRKVCSTQTEASLAQGECSIVSCILNKSNGGHPPPYCVEPIDVLVIADDSEGIGERECIETNNTALIHQLCCD